MSGSSQVRRSRIARTVSTDTARRRGEPWLPTPSRYLPQVHLLHSDILVPQLRLLGNERIHHADARNVLNDLYAHPARSQQLLFPHEGAVLADDDVRDAVEENGASAHRARGERRV